MGNRLKARRPTKKKEEEEEKAAGPPPLASQSHCPARVSACEGPRLLKETPQGV